MQRLKIWLILTFSLFFVVACIAFPTTSLVGNQTEPAAPTSIVVPLIAPIPTQTLAAPTPKIVVPTPTKLPPTPTAKPTIRPVMAVGLPKPYQVQPNSPLYIQNFTNPSKSCNWMGIAGQVFDLKGAPIKNLVLSVKGSLNGIPVDRVGVTGANSAYGSGGYEIVLSKRPFSTNGSINISLYDLKGIPLSDKLSLDTFEDCGKNLILVNFIQVNQ